MENNNPAPAKSKHAKFYLKCLSAMLSMCIIAACVPIFTLVSSADTYGDYEYSVSDSAVTIEKYNGTSQEIIISDTIAGCPVTKIGESAFSECSSLVSAVIPEGVESIGGSAFWRCEAIESITVPQSVTSIGDSAFSNCSKLAKVNLPDGITNISNSLFSFCTSLKSMTLPKSLTSIGDNAFCSCNSLTGLNIPEGVESIGDFAFSGCNEIESITVPQSVTSIGSYAFSNSSKLAKVNLPDGITNISEYLFLWCTSLKSMTLPENIKVIENGAFSSCQSLESVILNEGLQKIDNYSFSYCYSLKEIILPKSLTSIGNHAFSDCESLTGLNIPENVSEIGRGIINTRIDMMHEESDRAFEITVDKANKSYVAINNAIYSSDMTKLVTVADDKYHKTIVIEEGVTEICGFAFSGCSQILSITFPSTLKTIGEYAFSCCINLLKAELPYGLKSIGYAAFNYCSSMTAVTIPETVTDINFGDGMANMSGTFYSCESLKAICLPQAITTVGNRMFDYCSKLQRVSLSSKTTDIDEYAFSYCHNLKNIYLPDSLLLIGSHAFQGCENLTGITLPESVIKIADCAFAGCTFDNVIIPKSVTEIGSNAFGYDSYRTEKIENFSIFGYAGTCAEEYAAENGFNFFDMNNPVFETIAKIRAIRTVTAASGKAITDARKAYDALTAEQKTAVGEEYSTYLTDCENAFGSFGKESADTQQLIDSLPKITSPDEINSQNIAALKASLEKALQAYNALLEKYQNLFPDEEDKTVIDTARIAAIQAAIESYESSGSLTGDVDANGSVDSADALLVLQSTVGKKTLSPAQMLAADTNKDNSVDSKDALLILQFAVGKINSFN